MILSSLKDKYKGNRIFVVGNGRSLKDTNLDLIKNEYSFGINRIGLIFDKTIWRPTHFICATNRVKWSRDYRQDVLAAIDFSQESFIGYRIKDFLPENSNIYYIKCLHIKDDPIDDWWEDISNGEVSIFGQSLFGAMRIATYLGFNPIYLLGIDDKEYKNTGQKEDEVHFDPTYELGKHRDSSKSLREWHNPRIKRSHEIMTRMAKKHNFKIYNATIKTEVDYYPLVNFEEVVSG